MIQNRLERKKAYKNVDPLTTVNQIRNILYKNKIFTIEVSQKLEPITGVCSCRVIFGDDRYRSLNIGSNGKGMDSRYALASAYAEFMERLQNGATLWKVLGISESLPHSLNYNFNDMVGFAENFFELAYGENDYHHIAKKYIEMGDYKEGISFYEWNGSGRLVVPTALYNIMTGSNGMAAGNTIYEAIIQGLSEIFERYVISKLFLERITPPIIPIPIYEGTDVLERLKRLKKVGIEFKILDCSLDMELPVIGLLIEKNGKYHIHFGADPSPITALERCLTEIFQGRMIDELPLYDLFDDTDDVQKKFINEEKEYTDSTGKVPVWIINESSTYEFKGFSHPITISDEDDLKYYISILERLGKKLYVCDCGHLGFPCVRLYVPGMTENHCPAPEYCFKKKIPENIKNSVCRLPFLSDEEYFLLMQKLDDYITNELDVKDVKYYINNNEIKFANLLPPGDFVGKNWDDRLFVAAIMLKSGNIEMGNYYLEEYIFEKNIPSSQAELLRIKFKSKKLLFSALEWPNCPDCNKCKAQKKCKKNLSEELYKDIIELLNCGEC